ncbi:hypothetical protein SAMD00019534_034760, partial [Acytostelium subglobosum LB1]|uniref:hypothetical protein n=1 Tax=Acytostelium subglobosum LB1 TaxID=1410327 RepID=UPI0006450D6A
MGGDIHICALILSSKSLLILYISSLIGSSLSLFASLFNIIFYLLKRRRLFSRVEDTNPLLLPAYDLDNSINNNDNNNNNGSTGNISPSVDNSPRTINHLVFFLSVADFIACSALVLTQISMLFNAPFANTLNYCIAARSVIHFGFLSSFLWTNCIAYYLLREVFEWNSCHVPSAVYHVFSWGLALLGVSSFFFGDNVITQDENGCSRCSINAQYQLYLWVIPLIVSFVWNLLCYILIYRKFSRILTFGAFGHSSKPLKNHVAKKLTLYLGVFLLCWIWDVINHTVFLFRGVCPPFWLWILQDVMSPSQGFFNFLVYAFANIKVNFD